MKASIKCNVFEFSVIMGNNGWNPKVQFSTCWRLNCHLSLPSQKRYSRNKFGVHRLSIEGADFFKHWRPIKTVTCFGNGSLLLAQIMILLNSTLPVSSSLLITDHAGGQARGEGRRAKKYGAQNWNFQGNGGRQTKNPSIGGGGGYGYFLDSHITDSCYQYTLKPITPGWKKFCLHENTLENDLVLPWFCS